MAASTFVCIQGGVGVGRILAASVVTTLEEFPQADKTRPERKKEDISSDIFGCDITLFVS